MTRKNKFDFPTEEEKKHYLDEIITYFQKERDEEIGYVAAEQVLDFFISTMGDKIYKKALGDAKQILENRLEDIKTDLDILGD